MAGNATIGSGSLILSVAADQMVAGLAKAEAAAKKSAGRMGASLGGSAGLEMADLDKLTGNIDKAAQNMRLKLATMGQKSGQALVTGFRMSGASPAMLAEVTKLARQMDAAEDAQRRQAAAKRKKERREDVADAMMFGVASGLIAPVVGRIGAGIVDAFTHASKFAIELEKSVRLSAQIGSILDRSFRRSDAELGAFATRGDKLAEVERQLAMAEKNGRGAAAAVKSAEATLEKLGEWWGEGTGKNWWIWYAGGLDDAKKKAKMDLDEAVGTSTKFADRLAHLRELRGHLKDPSTDPNLKGEVNGLTESLRLQADTFGKSAAQASIFALKQKGATDAMLEDAKVQANVLDRLNAIANFKAPNGGAQKGTAEAFSIVARMQNQAVFADSGKEQLKQQLRELQKMPPLLVKIAGLLANGSGLRVI